MAGVLLLGPSGAGKSDLLLRLLDIGFALVADDRVEIADGWASAPPALAGLLEIRGLGVVRMAHQPRARLVLALELQPDPPRLPQPRRHPELDIPLLAFDPWSASAPRRAAVALACAQGHLTCLAGAFA